MIKAVIFDLGSVLVKGPWKMAYRNIAKETKIPLEKSIAIIQPIRERWSGAEINEQQFWTETERKIGKKLSSSFRKNLWYDTYLKKRRDIKSVWKIAAISAAFILLFERLGYLATSALYLFTLFFWVCRFRIGPALGFTAALTLATWYLFGSILGLQLPVGPWRL